MSMFMARNGSRCPDDWSDGHTPMLIGDEWECWWCRTPLVRLQDHLPACQGWRLDTRYPCDCGADQANAQLRAQA